MRRLVIGALAAFALGGCSLLKVNVNGREMSLADVGDKSETASNPASASAAPGQAAPTPINDNRKVETVVLDPASVNSVPKIVTVNGVGVQKSIYNGLRLTNVDCGQYTSEKPLASFELKADMPATFQVAVTGRESEGVILHKAGIYWTNCTYTVGQVPTMAAPREGWTKGTWDIYPVVRRTVKEGANFQVEFFDPSKPAPWSDKVQKLSIAKKLDKPMFVEITTRTDRVVMREAHAGYRCEKTPLPVEPDLAITLERPIPGLTVRPLSTKTPVTLRVETPKTARAESRKSCTSYRREVVASNYAPSWESPVELHFGREDEGTYGISLGTATADEAQKVTLMIFDASTKWDRAALVPPQGELPLQERILERYYPQLDTRELAIGKPDQQQLLAQVFANAPKELFVYSKLDLDKDLAQPWPGYISAESFPKKNEPMLLLEANVDHVRVLTADGVRYYLKATHVLPAPDGAVALPSAPRKLKKEIDFGTLIGMAPPSGKTIVAAYDARMKRYESCADRAWKPYGKQLDNATWTVRGSDGHSTTVESPKAQRIREAGQRAIDKACGSEAKLEKDKEATRAKLLVEVEKERAKLLTKAQPIKL